MAKLDINFRRGRRFEDRTNDLLADVVPDAYYEPDPWDGCCHDDWDVDPWDDQSSYDDPWDYDYCGFEYDWSW